MTITAGGVGAFPSLKGPRVFWVGVEVSDELAGLQKRIDEELSVLGFAPETRRFNPHLTLCRVKSPSDGRKLARVVTDLAPEIHEQWEAASFVLFRSVLTPAGAQYTALERFELKG